MSIGLISSFVVLDFHVVSDFQGPSRFVGPSRRVVSSKVKRLRHTRTYVRLTVITKLTYPIIQVTTKTDQSRIRM